jgi:hypothetical protein
MNTLDTLLQEYIEIPNKSKEGMDFTLNLENNDTIAAHAQNCYMQGLISFITHLIEQEENKEILEYLITEYELSLKLNITLIVCLYKRYLTLDNTNEYYYKKLAETIILIYPASAWQNAQNMYNAAQKHDWAAAKTLGKIIS